MRLNLSMSLVFALLLTAGARAEMCSSMLMTDPEFLVRQLVEQQVLRLEFERSLQQDMQTGRALDESMDKLKMLEDADELRDHLSDREIFSLLKKKQEARQKLEAEKVILESEKLSLYSQELTGSPREVQNSKIKQRKLDVQIQQINDQIHAINFDIATLPSARMSDLMTEVIRERARGLFDENLRRKQQQSATLELQQKQNALMMQNESADARLRRSGAKTQQRH